MNHWKQELDAVEAAAMRIDAIEQQAESEFDRVAQAAKANGDAERALETPEFAAWMAARRNSDAAWGRWFEVMGARPGDA